MKRWWSIQAKRIDALSLRERVFLFLSVMACCLAMVDVMWLSPAQLAHKLLKQRFEMQSTELQSVREAMILAPRPVDTTQLMRDEILATRTRMDAVNQNIKDVSPSETPGVPLAQAMVHLLRRHEGLTLLRTATLAPDVFGLSKPGDSGALPAGLTRQGVELTVSGAYPELIRYVQALEKELPQVRWGGMSLKSEKLPPELTLRLFLVGVPP